MARAKLRMVKILSRGYSERGFVFYDVTKDDLISVAGIPDPDVPPRRTEAKGWLLVQSPYLSSLTAFQSCVIQRWEVKNTNHVARLAQVCYHLPAQAARTTRDQHRAAHVIMIPSMLAPLSNFSTFGDPTVVFGAAGMLTDDERGD